MDEWKKEDYHAYITQAFEMDTWSDDPAVVCTCRLFFGGQSNQYTEEIARTQDIITYYTFSGNLEPGDAQVVYATGRGTVKELLKQEGDRWKTRKPYCNPRAAPKSNHHGWHHLGYLCESR